MIRLFKGIFSSSAPAPTSSDIKEEEEEEEAADRREESEAGNVTETHENDAEAGQIARPNVSTMKPPSTTNGTPKLANGAAVTSSAVKGSSGKKKNKGETADARHIKNQKKKERKRKKRDAVDSSAMESSVVDSSVMGDNTEPRGMGRRNSSFEDSFVSPDLSRNMSTLFGNVPMTQAIVEAPKPKLSKKEKKAAKKRLKDQAAATNGVASQMPPEPEPMEEETQDMQTVIRQAQIAKSKEKEAQEAIESAPVVESEDSGSRRESQSDEVNLEEGIKNTKQQAQQSQNPASQSIAGPQDEPISLPIHPPPAPALFSPSKPQEHSQPTAEDRAEAEAQIQSNAWSTGNIDPDQEADDEEEPIQPSKKSLGKRKASTPVTKSNAKRRKSKDSRADSATLGQFGFVPSPSQIAEKQALRNASRSVSHEPSVLGQEVANMFRSQMDERRSSESEIQASSFVAVNSGQQRRATPAFTPVNPRKRLAGVVIPAPARSPYELPPSSQPRPETEPELPKEATQNLIQSHPVTEPEVPQNTPASKEKRKRRLPTGDPESSQVKSKTTKRLRSKSEAAKDPTKATTPKQSASKAKTPKSKTPTVPADSQAAPASKGARLAPEDVDSIKKAVEFYRKQNDMREVDINALIQRETRAHPEFWAYMREEVPQVPQQKIANHCRRNFHNFEARGSWTEEANQDLKDAYERHPGKWKQIGEELNRFPEDCRDRWRNYLVCGDKMKKEPWTREEEEKLRDTIEELLRLVLEGEEREWESLTEQDQTKVDWLKVSEKMDGTRSRLQCQNKWKAIMEREDSTTKDPVAKQSISETVWRLEIAEMWARSMKPKEKLLLLYGLRESKAGREGKVPWTSIQRELGVKDRKMSFRVCFRNMMLHVPGYKEMKFQEVVSALIDLYEAASPREPKGFDTFVLADELYDEAGKLRTSSRRVSRDDGEDEDDDEDEDEDDDENEHALKQPSTQKKKRTSAVKKTNGRGSTKSTARLRLAKGRKAAMLSEMDHENDHSPVKTRSPKKLRSRMKAAGEKESQESQAGRAESGSADDIGEAFQAVNSSQVNGRSPRVAKKPIVGARTSRGGRRSAKWAVDSEDEEVVEVEAERSNIDLGEGAEDDADNDSIQPEKSMQQEKEEGQPDQEIDGVKESEECPDLDMDSALHEPEVAESDHNMDDAPPLSGYINSSDEGANVEEDANDDFPSTNHNTESVDLDEASHITSRDDFPGETDIDVEDEQRGLDGDDSDQESEDWTRVRRESVDGDAEMVDGARPEGAAESGPEYGITRRRVGLRNGSSSKKTPTDASFFGREIRNGTSQPNGGLDLDDEEEEAEASDGAESDVGIPPKTTPKPFLKNGFRQDTGTQASVSDNESDSSDDSDEDIPHTPKAKQRVSLSQKKGMGTGGVMSTGLTRGTLRSGRIARVGSVEL